MKKITAGLIGVLLLLFFFQSVSMAKEGSEKKIFGVGASVEKMDQGFTIHTKGEKSEEGFVYSPDEIKPGIGANFRVDLKGNVSVILQVEETDARGKFLKETRSSIQALTNDWKTYELTVPLSKNTAQVDAFALTSTKQKANFSIKNLEVLQK